MSISLPQPLVRALRAAVFALAAPLPVAALAAGGPVETSPINQTQRDAAQVAAVAVSTPLVQQTLDQAVASMPKVIEFGAQEMGSPMSAEGREALGEAASEIFMRTLQGGMVRLMTGCLLNVASAEELAIAARPVSEEDRRLRGDLLGEATGLCQDRWSSYAGKAIYDALLYLVADVRAGVVAPFSTSEDAEAALEMMDVIEEVVRAWQKGGPPE